MGGGRQRPPPPPGVPVAAGAWGGLPTYAFGAAAEVSPAEAVSGHSVRTGGVTAALSEGVGPGAAQFAADDARALAAQPWLGGAARVGGPAPEFGLTEEERRQAAAVARRGQAVLPIVAAVGGEQAVMLREVPAEKLIGFYMAAGSAMHMPQPPRAEWDHELQVPQVAQRLNELIGLSQKSAAQVLELAPAGMPITARAISSVDKLARSLLTSTGGNLVEKAHTDSKDGHGAIKKAAEGLAASAAATKLVAKARALAEAQSAEPTRPALRAAMRELEVGEFGEDVAVLLHQEKLNSQPSGTLSTGALQIVSAVRDIRSSLAVARGYLFQRAVPDGIDRDKLLAGVNCGAISVDLLTKPKSVGAELLKSLLRAWPLLTELMREIHPRDGGAPMALLELSKHVFDGSTAVQNSRDLVEAVLLEWGRRWVQSLAGSRMLSDADFAVTYSYVKEEKARQWGMQASLGGKGGGPPYKPPDAPPAEPAVVPPGEAAAAEVPAGGKGAGGKGGKGGK